MQNYYITFGSDERFPYPNRFIVVLAESEWEANRIFETYHPNRPGSDCLNYSFLYTSNEWEAIKDVFYKGLSPAEILTRDGVVKDMEEEEREA
jgi:hypothetical protein